MIESFNHKEVIGEIRKRIANLPAEQLQDAYELLGCLKKENSQYDREVIAGTLQEILFPEWLLLLGKKSLHDSR